MYFKEENEIDIDSISMKQTYSVAQKKPCYYPSYLEDPYFSDFPNIKYFFNLDFHEAEAFEQLYASGFTNYICHKINFELNNQNGQYFSDVFRKKKSDPLLLLSEVCIFIAIAPKNMQLDLINTEFPDCLINLLNSPNTQIQENCLMSISALITGNVEYIECFRYKELIPLICDILANAIKDKIRDRCAYMLTVFLQIQLEDEEIQVILTNLLKIAKIHHRNYNNYLIVALYYISRHSAPLLLQFNRYQSLTNFIDIPDPVISEMARCALINAIPFMNDEIINDYVENQNILKKIEHKLTFTLETKCIQSYLRLLAEILTRSPKHFQNCVDLGIFNKIGCIIQTEVQQKREQAVNFLVYIYPIFQNAIFEVIPIEFDLFSNLLDQIGHVSDDLSIKILEILANHMKITIDFPGELAEDFRDTLIELTENEGSIGELAHIILDDLFREESE